MHRYVLHLMLLGLITTLAYHGTAQSQDKVERKDRKAPDKPIVRTGQITDESLAGIKMKVSGVEETIPGTDVLRVFYNDLPAAGKLAMNNVFIAEEKEKDPAKLLKSYQDLVPQITAAGPNPKRFVQYRIALLSAQAAQTDPEKAQAFKLLQDFATANGTSWQYPAVARVLVRLQLDKQDLDGARKTLESLVKPNMPAEVRQEAENMYIDVLFQANEFDKVKDRITAAMGTATEVQRSRFAVYEIGCEAQGEFKIEDVVKKLDSAIKGTNDNVVKALAYNVMGDCYMKKGKKRDAMWSWLWVDVVYYQDAGERMKAMTKLREYFKGEQDEEKARLYEEKIKQAK